MYFLPIKKIAFALLVVCSAFVLQSCGDSDSNSEPEPEYIVDAETLKDYKNWELIAAFDREDNNQHRRVFVNRPETSKDAPRDGYPVGTIFVKEISDLHYPVDSVIRYQVMVKRGGDFDPAHNDWEWILSTGGDISQITSRGGGEVKVGNTNCVTCHKNTAGNDWAFFSY